MIIKLAIRMFAELQFYEENSTSIVKGWVIGSEKIYKKDPNMTREKAFDRSRLTIFHVEKLDGGWDGTVASLGFFVEMWVD